MGIEQIHAGPDNRLPGDYELRHEAPDIPTHRLDSHEALVELRKVEDWWHESGEALAECFAEMGIDHDYYDHLQLTEEEKAEMLSRGQAPLVYNKASMVVDWLTGTERRTRIDFNVTPKNREAAESAAAKLKLLKYQSDTNYIGWNRSRAFKDAAIGGVGWTETGIRGDSDQELVLHAYVPWQHMRWDPFHRALDLDDCRYLHRKKWLDLDFAIAMAQDREAQIRGAARSHLFGDEEWASEQLDLPQVFRRYDSRGSEVVQRRWSGGVPFNGNANRLRVPVVETWYRHPKRIKRFYGLDARGIEYDPNNTDMLSAVQSGYASLSDAVSHEMRVALWVPGALLWMGPSPYRHRQFPFTPIWAKRRARDGTPYGVMRGIRDAQDDINKRFSKTNWLLATNQLLFESGAIDPDRKADVQRNMARPNGMVEFKDGALVQGRIRIERNLELADAQVKMIEVSAAHVHDGGGVNREQLGRDTNATSGRAIRAKQDEGSVTTAEIFDNQRLHDMQEGKKLLSLNEQYMTLPLQILVAGDDAKKGHEWLELNTPELQDDGSWRIRNDITQNDAVYAVDQIDYRESVRQAAAEQFAEMLKVMPPEVQLMLLDIYIDMTDVPNRDEAVRRIRAVTGQTGPGEEANDPAAIARKQAEDEAQEQERQLVMRERLAKVGLDEAKTQQIMALARESSIKGKAGALDLAKLIEILLPLAPAADRLYQTPEEGNVQHAAQ